MDKVFLQIENDYATQDKWKSYAHNNDFKTFMLLFVRCFFTKLVEIPKFTYK